MNISSKYGYNLDDGMNHYFRVYILVLLYLSFTKNKGQVSQDYDDDSVEGCFEWQREFESKCRMQSLQSLMICNKYMTVIQTQAFLINPSTLIVGFVSTLTLLTSLDRLTIYTVIVVFHYKLGQREQCSISQDLSLHVQMTDPHHAQVQD